jgi:predicted nuclease of predicted toxin-antitoxin system
VRLYLDQMLRAEFATILRDAGHEVIRASEIGQSRADDALILEQAVKDQRTLITLDGHFGDWVVLPLSKHWGVIRVRVHPPSTENIENLLLPFLAAHSQEEFYNHLVIVSPSRVRWIRTADE